MPVVECCGRTAGYSYMYIFNRVVGYINMNAGICTGYKLHHAYNAADSVIAADIKILYGAV